jgi:hypothetical protein
MVKSMASSGGEVSRCPAATGGPLWKTARYYPAVSVHIPLFAGLLTGP